MATSSARFKNKTKRKQKTETTRPPIKPRFAYFPTPFHRLTERKHKEKNRRFEVLVSGIAFCRSSFLSLDEEKRSRYIVTDER